MRLTLSPTTYAALPGTPVASPQASTVAPQTTLTYTFDPLLSTPKDRVRAALGDRDMADPLRSDEEIGATIDLEGGDELLATADLAEGLAAEYARRVDSYSDSGTGISVRWGERVKTWLALADGIRTGYAATAAASGGVAGVAVRLDADGYASEYVRGCSGTNWFTE